MTIEEAITFSEYAQIMAEDKPGFRSFYRLAESALRAQQQAVANKPLTLDELRKMEGEPVWVVFGECGDWRIPDFIDIGAYRGFIRFTDRSSEFLDDYGKDWLAYRHKTEEVQA